MKFFKSLLSAVLVILLFVSSLVFAFAFSADRRFLSEDFYTQALDELGIYDKVYDDFMEKPEPLTEWYYLQKGVAEWYLDGYSSTCTRETMIPVMKDGLLSIRSYIRGDSLDTGLIDLSTADAALKENMVSSLDADTAVLYLNQSLSTKAVFLKRDVLEAREAGTFSRELQERTVDMFLYEYDRLEEGVLISTPAEAFDYLDYPNAAEFYEILIRYGPVFHRMVIPLLLFVCFLSLMLIIMWLKKIRTGFLLNGWPYMIVSVGVIITGIVLKSSHLYSDRILNLLDTTATDIIRDWNLAPLVPLCGDTVVLTGLVLFAAAIVFLILARIFRGKKREAAK